MKLEHIAGRSGRLSSFLREEMQMSIGLVNRLKWQEKILVNGAPQHNDFAVKTGDVIRFGNAVFYDLEQTEQNPRAGFKFYDSSFALVVESDTYTPSSPPSAAWSPVHGSGGDLVQVTVPASYSSSVAYVRICMRDLNSKSIITVNEAIG